MAREALLTSQISATVTDAMKAELKRLHETYKVSEGEVVRLGLENDGLKSVEAILRRRRTLAAETVSLGSVGTMEFTG